MSTEIVLYPKSATKDQIRAHLLSIGFLPCGHMWNWPKGSIHFSWFEMEDYKSITGVEATIYPPSEDQQKRYGTCGWALHTRTRASGSRFDKEYQNHTIRSARKLFGGDFINDWYGKNRYIPLWEDKKGPIGRGLFLSYELVKQNLDAVRCALPQPMVEDISSYGKMAKFMGQSDPVRVLYNALVPFVVAALEHFFSQTFKILLKYDESARKRLQSQGRKVDIQDALALSVGEKTIEEIVANWYSFQNIQSIHSAFRDWVGIDLWKLLRQKKRIGRKVAFLEQQLDELIEFRHGIIHRFECNFDLTRNEIEEVLSIAEVVIDTFVDYLQQEKGIVIRN